MSAIEYLLAACRWPQLTEPYAMALRGAVHYILEHIDDLQGIVVSGTIIRGNPAPTSDLDIEVIHDPAWRQRRQKFFNGVPAEIFINPPHQIEAYFREERVDGRPNTAHMFATGFIVLDRNGQAARFQQQARHILDDPPDLSDQQLTGLRYGCATAYEDAADMVTTHPDITSMILGVAVHDMLRYAWLAANRRIPRQKDMLASLPDLDPGLARLAHDFYRATTATDRLDIAGQIADRTIQTRGFFEWESEIGAV